MSSIGVLHRCGSIVKSSIGVLHLVGSQYRVSLYIHSIALPLIGVLHPVGSIIGL